MGAPEASGFSPVNTSVVLGHPKGEAPVFSSLFFPIFSLSFRWTIYQNNLFSLDPSGIVISSLNYLLIFLILVLFCDIPCHHLFSTQPKNKKEILINWYPLSEMSLLPLLSDLWIMQNMGKNCEFCTEWQEHWYWSHMADENKHFFKFMVGDFTESMVRNHPQLPFSFLLRCPCISVTFKEFLGDTILELVV